MPTISGGQKKYLRGLAHGLKPIVRVGKGGLTENVLAHLDQALDAHELVKVKLTDSKGQRRKIGEQIEADLRAVQAGAIGHMAIFYRQASDPEKRMIELPRHPKA